MAEDAHNLALWNQIETTDPKHTKAITGKSYQGTSPKPHYLVHKATETFGPIGIGWGFNIVSERIEDGAGGERMHIAHVRVWYIWGGKRGEVEHIGGTQFSGIRSSGKPFTDEDAPKKSVTDALVKALSMIGFAGDIFMGRYDDSKYVSELRHEFAEASEPELKQQLVKVSRDAEKQMREEVDACATEEELKRLWGSKLFQAEYEKLHQTYKDGIVVLFNERLEFLRESPASVVLRGTIPANFDAIEEQRT